MSNRTESYLVGLATLPQVAEPAGYNFAEVKAVDTTGLETVLGQLGFGFNGRHRTKDVQLWTTGHARVIVNEAASGGYGAPNAPVRHAVQYDHQPRRNA